MCDVAVFRDNDLAAEAGLAIAGDRPRMPGQLPSRHSPANSQAYPHRSTWLEDARLESAGWTWPHPHKPLQQQSRISMPRSALARELSQAEEQVAKDPDRIAHQRAVVSHHKEGGLDGAIARAILDQLGTLQRAHIADRDRLLAEAALENKPVGK
jgi:hypothetical protein